MRDRVAGAGALLALLACGVTLVAANQRILPAAAIIGTAPWLLFAAWRAVAPQSYARLRDPRLPVALAGAGVVALGAVSTYAGFNRAFASDLRALAASIPDDSFYYLLPAFRLKTAGFFTFDGIHPTYGFQPLWELVLAALAFGVRDREAFLRVALFLPHLARLATAGVLFRVGYEMRLPDGRSNALAALAAPGLYLLNVPLFFASVDGKENALYGLMLATLLMGLLRVKRRAAAASRRLVAAIGACLALALLTRISPGSLAVTLVAAAYVWRVVPRQRAALVFAFTGPVAAWGAYALATFDTVFPVSGTVKLQGFFDAPPWTLNAAGAVRLLGSSAEYLVQAVCFSVGLGSSFGAMVGRPTMMLFRWLSAALALAVGVSLGRRIWRADRGLVAEPVVLLLCAALAGTAAVPVFLDHLRPLWYFKWYLVELPVLLAVMSASVVRVRARGVWLTAIAMTLSIVVARDAILLRRSFRPLRAFHEEDTWQNAMLRASERMKHLTGAQPARIGAFNAGLLGYLSDVPVVNLDGLANDDVVWSLRAGESLYGYVARNRIAYIVDVMPAQGWFGNHFAHYDLLERLPFSLGDPPGYFIARVTDEDFPAVAARDCPTPGSGIRLVKWTDEPVAGGHQRIIVLETDARVPTRVVFALDRRFRSFECLLAVESATQARGRAAARVSFKLDGKVVSRGFVRSTLGEPRRIHIETGGRSRLAIVVARRGAARERVRVNLVGVRFMPAV